MNLTVQEMKDRFRIRQKAKLIRWLKEQGFKFRVAPDGWPILDAAYVERMLHGNPPASVRAAPDVRLDHLKGTHGKTTQAQA